MNKKEYIADYNKRIYKGYTLRLRRDQDADLIAYLDSRGESPQNVIKEMLRRSMRASRGRRAEDEAKGYTGNVDAADRTPAGK